MTTKFLILALFCFANQTSWDVTNIGNGLTIKFPNKAKTEVLFGVLSYESENKNCQFFVDIDKLPVQLFPKNDMDVTIMLDRTVAYSKKRGVYISSKYFKLGKIKGIELTQFFTPEKSVKLVERIMTFYHSNCRYDLRCLSKNLKQFPYTKDCETFFTSLKYKGK